MLKSKSKYFLQKITAKLIVLFAFASIFSVKLLAVEDYQGAFPENLSFSIDPLTFATILLNSHFEEGEFDIDWRGVWFAGEMNYQTENRTELGFGLFLSNHNVAVTAKHRSFYNEEQLRGFFWGYYGLVEWRRMHWWKNSSAWPNVSWNFPVDENANVYHSFGVTAGADIGFRYRKEHWGITAYLGLGLPLYFCFGDLPNRRNIRFELINIGLRAIHLGVRVDLFPLFPIDKEEVKDE